MASIARDVYITSRANNIGRSLHADDTYRVAIGAYSYTPACACVRTSQVSIIIYIHVVKRSAGSHVLRRNKRRKTTTNATSRPATHYVQLARPQARNSRRHSLSVHRRSHAGGTSFYWTQSGDNVSVQILMLSIVMSTFVWPLARSCNSKTTQPNFTEFLYELSVASDGIALRYVMYFRFCGWRHVSSYCNALWCVMRIFQSGDKT